MVIEDALAANGPHLQTLPRYGRDFIIVAKPGGHAALFDAVPTRRPQGTMYHVGSARWVPGYDLRLPTV